MIRSGERIPGQYFYNDHPAF